MSLRKKTIILFTAIISFICLIIAIITITNVRSSFETAITEKIESDNKSSFELLNLKYPEIGGYKMVCCIKVLLKLMIIMKL